MFGALSPFSPFSPFSLFYWVERVEWKRKYHNCMECIGTFIEVLSEITFRGVERSIAGRGVSFV